jgi:hypothetical protein
MLHQLAHMGIDLSENDIILFYARYAESNSLSYS